MAAPRTSALRAREQLLSRPNQRARQRIPQDTCGFHHTGPEFKSEAVTELIQGRALLPSHFPSPLFKLGSMFFSWEPDLVLYTDFSSEIKRVVVGGGEEVLLTKEDSERWNLLSRDV